MNFLEKGTSFYPLGQIIGARGSVVFKRKFKMADEDSHSTDASVSGEGHSTI